MAQEGILGGGLFCRILSAWSSAWHVLGVCVYMCAQSCPTFRDILDCNPPGSSVHEVFQARILEWVALSSSRGSS